MSELRGNRVRSENPVGNRTTYAYDAPGLRSLRIDARGHRTTYIYDAASRLTQRRYPDGSRTTWVYDAAGNPLQIASACQWPRFSCDSPAHVGAAAGRNLRPVEYARDISPQERYLRSTARYVRLNMHPSVPCMKFSDKPADTVEWQTLACDGGFAKCVDVLIRGLETIYPHQIWQQLAQVDWNRLWSEWLVWLTDYYTLLPSDAKMMDRLVFEFAHLRGGYDLILIPEKYDSDEKQFLILTEKSGPIAILRTIQDAAESWTPEDGMIPEAASVADRKFLHAVTLLMIRHGLPACPWVTARIEPLPIIHQWFSVEEFTVAEVANRQFRMLVERAE